MCSVIEYGFTINGTLRGTPPCNATTSDTLGARASISIETSDIGLPLYAYVRVNRNGTAIGNFKSTIFTPTYAPGLHTFTIPFTGLTTQTGTYTFGFDGCVFIDTETGQYCYSCISDDCFEVTVTEPLKWECSGSPNYTCSQTTDGTYNTESECITACNSPTTDKYYDCVDGICKEVVGGQYINDPTCNGTCQQEQPNNTPLIIAGVGLGLAVIYFLSKGK